AEAGRERSLQELSEATLTLKDQQKGAEEGRARADEEAVVNGVGCRSWSMLEL
ncbi:hypothetical protein Pmar_PMAR026819, partial [Perkinsus marinus ATCC 50983]